MNTLANQLALLACCLVGLYVCQLIVVRAMTAFLPTTRAGVNPRKPSLRYRKIYRYMTDEDIEDQTTLRKLAQHPRNCPPELAWIRLLPNGKIHIRKGYSWDGASGPAIDTPNFMRASLVHDALYQLIEVGQLNMSDRKEADRTMYAICKRDGMGWFRRWYVYRAVRRFGGLHLRLASGAILVLFAALSSGCALLAPPACSAEDLAELEGRYLAEVLAACHGQEFDACEEREPIEQRYAVLREEWAQCRR